MIKRTRMGLVSAALIVLAAFWGGQVYAQASLSFDVDISSPLAPVATWSTTPAASSCETSWSGTVGASGSETLPAIRTSGTYSITCDFPGDSIATLNWLNPTENTDATPYTNPGVTRLVWSTDGLADFDCLAPMSSGDAFIDRPGDQTMHTITGLAPGTWEFTAYAVNTLGLCSGPSNVASKMITGSMQLSDSVTISVPAPVSGLGAT